LVWDAATLAYSGHKVRIVGGVTGGAGVFRFEAEHTVSSLGGELRGEGLMLRPAERVSYASVARGLSGSLPLESVRRSGRFEELLDSVGETPVPTDFDLSRFVGSAPAGGLPVPDVSLPEPVGSLAGFEVDGPSVVEQGVASARASRLGRSAPSLDDWAVAGAGRG